MNRAVWGLGSLAAGILWLAAPAPGDVFNDLLNGKSAADGFIGTWQGAPGSDIDHVVVTASSSGPVRIQVFGRCEARFCNWGVLPARIRTDGPSSEVVRSLSADFNLGFALRHVTLHRATGNQLHVDMVTEFTDGSDRHDYETTGQLVPAGAAMATAPAPNIAPAPNAAAAPTVAPPRSSPPAAGAGITALNPMSWFSSKPAPAERAAPQDSSSPVAASSAAVIDDCIAIDAGHLYVAMSNDNWNLRDFLHVAQSFGPYKLAASKGLAISQFYHFDEVCHVGRGTTNLGLLRVAGEVPHQAMGGEDCSDVHPDKVAVEQRDDSWKVLDGGREIFDYGSDRESAEQAASVIKSLNLSRQCYYDRANLATSYWLSR